MARRMKRRLVPHWQLVRLFECSPCENVAKIIIFMSVHPCVHLSIHPSLIRVRSISPILFEVGIPNLMCEHTLGSRGIAYYFWVTLILTSGLIRVRSISPILFEVGIPNLMCEHTLGSRGIAIKDSINQLKTDYIILFLYLNEQPHENLAKNHLPSSGGSDQSVYPCSL